jgi:ribosomal protein S27E
MAILEKEVWVGISNKVEKYYEELGYVIPKYQDKYGNTRIKMGTKILVKIEDLPLGSNIKVTKICDLCGKHIMQSYNAILSIRKYGNGIDQCKACALIKSRKNIKENVPFERSLENYALNNNKEYLLAEYSDKNNEIPLKVYRASRFKYIWNCSNCKNEFSVAPYYRTSMDVGCPICSESKGEKRIRSWLNERHLYFEAQKEFDCLFGIGGGYLSYDFYLPNENLLIEYQGEFHDGNGNEYLMENLKYQQEHDRRKRAYAYRNNIKLLEIWYWDYDNIEKILDEKITKSKTLITK